jgi:hypothetical protein
MERNTCQATAFVLAMGLTLFSPAAAGGQESSLAGSTSVNEALEWNQTFVEMLIATNTANSSSPRLGAIVHTAIFDAYNGVEQRYSPIFVRRRAPRGASRRAAIVAAAYTTLVDLFPSQKTLLDARYAASLAALRGGCEGDGSLLPSRRSCALGIDGGIKWGFDVAAIVLGWRGTDGFSASYPPFLGGTTIGQWRPTPLALSSMSALPLAYTNMFVLHSNIQFQPGPPRSLTDPMYTEDFNAVKALGRRTGSTRNDDQTALALFWEGNASVHWNQAANQLAGVNHLTIAETARLLAVLNIAMADTAFTSWSAKRFYGSVALEVTWRPVTSIPLAGDDRNPDTVADPEWLPLINTPAHPEYPSGHASLNGAAAAVLLSHFPPRQTFTLTTEGQPSRSYASILQARSDANNARVWGGMHYPSTIRISDGMGQAIANFVNQITMQRLGSNR